MRHSPRALLLPLLAASGCAVGMVRVTAPERSPRTGLPPLAQRIDFDVCILPEARPLTPRQVEGRRRSLGDRIRGALSRAGVSADLTPAPGSPVRFTVTEGPTESDHTWSLALSMLTFSAIPGYSVERTRLDVNIASRDSLEAGRREHLRYDYGMSYFVWAPLVVYPDFFLSLNGGWESSEAKDGGFERTVAHLADDLRELLARDGAGAPEVGVVCATPGSSGRVRRRRGTRRTPSAPPSA